MEFFTTIQDITVHLDDAQHGDPVLVLLHGYLETLSIWDDLIQRLPRSIRTIAVELPGHGFTGGRQDVNTVEYSASIVYDAVKKCGVDAAYVMGHSMGGYVALAVARLYPDFTKGLILLHSTPFADTDKKRAGRDREIAAIEQNKLTTVAALSIPKMFAPENLPRMQDKIEELVELCEIHDPQGIIACLRGLKERPDVQTFFASFKKPLLLFFGMQDRYIHIETARQIEADFPHANCVFLEHSAHNSFLEEPEIVVRNIIVYHKKLSNGYLPA